MLLVSDRALLDGFRAARPEVLKTVYLHYRPRLCDALRAGFTFRSGEAWMRFRGYQRPFELEQAASETLARAFLPSARLAYDGLRPFADYLFGIARNLVVNELRRTDLLVLVGGDDELAPAAAGGLVETPEPSLEEREIHRLLDTFLAEATPVERRLFELRFRDERNQDEAARALELSRIQLRRIEYKLKRRLLAYLKKHGYLADVPRALLGAGLQSVLL